jgi:hypothetical protein
LPEGNFELPIGTGAQGVSASTFDNAGADCKAGLFRHLARLLKPEGRLVNLMSSEERYRLEWASFSTAPFPPNAEAKAGEPVFTIMKDVPDARPVEDVFCSERLYLELYRQAGLVRVAAHRPLGRSDEPFAGSMRAKWRPGGWMCSGRSRSEAKPSICRKPRQHSNMGKDACWWDEKNVARNGLTR